MVAPKEILELIERFSRHIDTYKSGSYNETQVRREFIDPLFKALGWDIDNEKGYSEVYKEVIHEDAIKIGGLTKAPDYCFRLGGIRKFFVEAKKPSVDVKDDIHPAFQLRRYLWSAKLQLSILTDFEEFAVYDGRVRPSPKDKPSVARTYFITYQDYADRWEELVSLFSPEAILKGSFDRYAESSKIKKGTDTVDEVFLKEIESWRNELARNIALRNDSLTQRELNFAVQQTIDRIIFLRICEDRGIESYGQLMALQNGDNAYERLVEYFRRADDRYNSGLFHFKKEKERDESPDTLTLSLKIDDKVLKDIFKNLYYPESPYEFSVLSADILGQVYEQFLGKVIRLTDGHRAVVEDKPETKKAGGVYYTPTYIVDYIVKHTLGKMLESKRPKQIAGLSVLDPACGSGSFLIVAYQCLLDWYRDRYIEDGPEKYTKKSKPLLFRGPGGDWRLTTAERKRILLEHIYGVDIDAQAVEVTKLSLLLKVLEGESGESLQNQLRLFQERALPDLGSNIKCGNSLIGPDFYEGQQMGMAGVNDEDRLRINVFDWESEFSKVMKSGGFDAVIGNPPYITYALGRGRLKHEDHEITYIAQHYPHSSEYKINSFAVFYERALFLCCNKGMCAYIVPGTILINQALSKIRKYFLTQARVCRAVQLNYKVFRGAEMGDCAILFVEKRSTKTYPVELHKYNSENWKTDYTHSNVSSEVILGLPEARIFLQKYVYGFLKIGERQNIQPLASVALFYNGIKTGDNKKFLSDKKLTSRHVSVVRGRDFDRYGIVQSQIYVDFDPETLWSNTDPKKLDVKNKILIRQTGDKLTATLDTSGVYCMDTIHFIYESKYEQKFLLGLINSKFINIYHQCLVPELGKAFAEVKIANLQKLPIPKVSFSNASDKTRHDKMVELVEVMLNLHKQHAIARTDHEKNSLQRQITSTDRQIDSLVYELYGLTKEEIEIVERAGG